MRSWATTASAPRCRRARWTPRRPRRRRAASRSDSRSNCAGQSSENEGGLPDRGARLFRLLQPGGRRLRGRCSEPSERLLKRLLLLSALQRPEAVVLDLGAAPERGEVVSHPRLARLADDPGAELVELARERRRIRRNPLNRPD